MAGRVSALTFAVLEARQQMALAAERERRDAAVRRRACLDYCYSLYYTFESDIGDEWFDIKQVVPVTQVEEVVPVQVVPEVLDVECGANDAGFCYVGMAAQGRARELSSLGPYPAVGDILGAPVELFTWPLQGGVTVVDDKLCHIECGPLFQGVALEKYFSFAADTSNAWLPGTLGERLTVGHLARQVMADQSCASEARDEGVIWAGKPPETFPDGTQIVCDNSFMSSHIQVKYPACKVVSPAHMVRVADVVYFSSGNRELDRSVGRRVAQSVYRSMVWVSIHPPPAALMRSSFDRAGVIINSLLTSVRCGGVAGISGYEGPGVVGGLKGRIKEEQLGVSDDLDDDFLFLCYTQEEKAVLMEYYPTSVSRVLTMEEARGLVAGDVYVFSAAAVAEFSGRRAFVVYDATSGVDLASVGARRKFYHVAPDPLRSGSVRLF